MPEIHPEVRLTQDLFSNYSSARSDWASQAAEDAEFRAGKQWSDKQVKSLRARAQEPLVVNVIHPAVEQAKAMLTANSPKFQSTGRDQLIHSLFISMLTRKTRSVGMLVTL